MLPANAHAQYPTGGNQFAAVKLGGEGCLLSLQKALVL